MDFPVIATLFVGTEIATNYAIHKYQSSLGKLNVYILDEEHFPMSASLGEKWPPLPLCGIPHDTLARFWT